MYIYNVKYENKHPWLILYKCKQVTLRYKWLSITPKILLIKDFNYETKDKATHIGSTALMLMFLPNGENIKTQVHSLPVSFKQPLFPSYDMIISNSMNYSMFCHLSSLPRGLTP